MTVINPGGLFAQFPDAYTALDSLDDLYPRAGSFWLDPLTLRQGDPRTPTMGIVVRRSGGDDVLPSVPVDFYYQVGSGSPVHIGRAETPPLAPDDHEATLPLAWAEMPAAGTYILHAIIDPENSIPETVEDNNTIIRTVIILPPLADTIPPFVQSMRINNGEQQTVQRQVYLNAIAQDDPQGSGVASLLYVEYVYVHSRGDWVPAASSGWQPYAETSVNYPWLLNSVPGVHYVRVWAADAAGNISTNYKMAPVNLVPESVPAAIATDEVHAYRFQLQAGQSMSLTLTSVSGDADAYVFGPDDDRIAYSIAEDEVEELGFTADVAGIYQIEIHGYAAGSYTLQFVAPGVAQVQRQRQVRLSQSKEPRTQPLLSVTNTPVSDGYAAGVPSAPIKIEYLIYLPLVMRNAP